MPAKYAGESQALYKHVMVGDVTPNSAADTISDAQFNTANMVAGCLLGGAVGDALGSFYEGKAVVQSVNFEMLHGITDDTQLTLATCEAIIESGQVSAESIARKMLEWYNKRKLTGLGASTLKALRDLQVGAHWALSGRSGEYAAGNGAAMRIAPLAFFVNLETDRTLIRDVCNITHKNDEAYTGCLAILYAIQYIITDKWLPQKSLIELITPELPDTSVRDNLLKLQTDPSLSIREAALLVGTSGHVIASVPLAIFAAQKIRESSFDDILTKIIRCGGDTDTNASLAGQMMGAFLKFPNFSKQTITAFVNLKEYTDITKISTELSKMLIVK
jgi:ADP-ribosyl-[dinitrogen reductase] hydrolase